MAKKNLSAKIKKIKMVVMDVDGVLTDGKIIVGKFWLSKIELKNFHSHDGIGIRRALELGLLVGLISARPSDLVSWRAKELGITTVYHGVEDKLNALEEIKKENNLTSDQIAFIGDDILDLPALKHVGFSAAPANAVDEIQEQVDYISKHAGGDGAVREIIDLILKTQGLI